MCAISQLEQKLRDLINSHRRHFALRQDAQVFGKLCSALDALGDAEMGFEAYLTGEHVETSVGQNYLNTYGVLQIMFVQQDAVKHIAESLAIKYTPDEDLRMIREIRNDSIGHPSQRRKPPNGTFNHISRITMSWKGFDLITFGRQGNPEHKTIDIISLLETQRRLIAIDLQRFVNLEVRRESEHRQRFRLKPLVRTLPDTLNYYLGKLSEEIEGVSALGNGSSLATHVRSAISSFEQTLIECEELPAIQDVFDYHAKPARHALDRLDQFFGQDTNDSLNKEDAKTFLFRLGHEINALRGLAREIDETNKIKP